MRAAPLTERASRARARASLFEDRVFGNAPNSDIPLVQGQGRRRILALVASLLLAVLGGLLVIAESKEGTPLLPIHGREPERKRHVDGHGELTDDDPLSDPHCEESGILPEDLLTQCCPDR